MGRPCLDFADEIRDSGKIKLVGANELPPNCLALVVIGRRGASSSCVVAEAPFFVVGEMGGISGNEQSLCMKFMAWFQPATCSNTHGLSSLVGRSP
jgi:hypothetical protein